VDLLRALQTKNNLAFMFISHDLKVVRALASELIIMKQGRVVEQGDAAEIFSDPKHEYTKALFAAAFNIETLNGLRQ
jgi:microcin C transport system ATP-binding protein